MGRAQAAYRSPLGRSCSLDRFASRDVFDDGISLGDLCAGVAGAGRVLPVSTQPATPSSDEETLTETDTEVVLRELWYHLPKEEQIRFGGCFSRMILKILHRCAGSNQENES